MATCFFYKKVCDEWRLNEDCLHTYNVKIVTEINVSKYP
jgi:hypothetical protein